MKPAPCNRVDQIPSQLLHLETGEWYFGLGWSETAADVQWMATIWPAARESFFALGWLSLIWNIDWDEAAWQNIHYLPPLLDGGTPLRPAGLRLLATALAAKQPNECGLATDVAITAIDDGRLGTDNLGAVLAELLDEGLVKPTRWAAQLAEVASISELHAHVVFTGLMHAFRGQAASMPRGFGKLVELALQLAAQLHVGVTDTEARSCLETLSGSSKTAKAARQLLKLTPGRFHADLLETVINTRLDRIDDWTARRA